MPTYYVRPTNGSDANDGLSFAAAFSTTQKAATVVAAGDTVRLCAEAVETPAATISISTSGATPNFITWIGCDASGVELPDGSYYTISGSILAAGTDIVYCVSELNRFRHMAFVNAPRYCWRVTSSLTTTLTACRFATAGTALLGPDGTVGTTMNLIACLLENAPFGTTVASGRQSPSLLGCVLRNITGAAVAGGAIIIPEVSGCVFVNCGTGIVGSNGLSGSFVDHCTFYGCETAIGLADRTATQLRLRIANCSFVNCTYAIRPQADQTTITTYFNDHNHFHGCTNNYTGGVTAGLNDISGDPLFVDAVNGDFTPGPGSPLIRAGFNKSTVGAVSPAAGGSGSPIRRVLRGSVIGGLLR